MENKLCIICGNELQGAQKKYCSIVCKNKATYLNYKDNPNSTFAQTIRAYRRKLKLIELKGGKCECCGYDKNIAALDFHHINANNKEFGLDARKLSNTKWEILLEEVNKCILLCANCHRELHNPEMTKDNIEQLKLKSEFDKLNNEEQIHYNICPVCGKKISKSESKKYCSKECWDKAFGRDKYPTKDEINIKYNELRSWQKVAKYYNLTRRIIDRIRNK